MCPFETEKKTYEHLVYRATGGSKILPIRQFDHKRRRGALSLVAKKTVAGSCVAAHTHQAFGGKMRSLFHAFTLKLNE